jgi:pimeloyl-ACP methyl ester carboxylesterase
MVHSGLARSALLILNAITIDGSVKLMTPTGRAKKSGRTDIMYADTQNFLHTPSLLGPFLVPKSNGKRSLDLCVKAPDGALFARVLVPEGFDASLPPLVALHGIARDAGALEDAFGADADAAGRVLVVPHFSADEWPVFQRIDRARPDRVLLALLSQVRETLALRTGKVELFGFSGGAQLAHRFAMLLPQRVTRLHIASPGWFCLPDSDAAFPAGLADPAVKRRRSPDIAAAMRAQIDNYLRLPVRVYVGSRDTHNDKALRKDPVINATQGVNRRQRAETYVRRFAAAAARRGILPDVRLSVLKNCSHDFIQCAQRAALSKLVLGDKYLSETKPCQIQPTQ